MLVVMVKIRGMIETLALQTVLYYMECMNNRCLVSGIIQSGVKMKVCFQQNCIVLQHYESVLPECRCLMLVCIREAFLFDCWCDRCEWNKEMKGYSVCCWIRALLCRDEVLVLISHHFIFSNSSCFQIKFLSLSSWWESEAFKLDWEQCSQWSVITVQDTV